MMRCAGVERSRLRLDEAAALDGVNDGVDDGQKTGDGQHTRTGRAVMAKNFQLQNFTSSEMQNHGSKTK